MISVVNISENTVVNNLRKLFRWLYQKYLYNISEIFWCIEGVKWSESSLFYVSKSKNSFKYHYLILSEFLIKLLSIPTVGTMNIIFL